MKIELHLNPDVKAEREKLIDLQLQKTETDTKLGELYASKDDQSILSATMSDALSLLEGGDLNSLTDDHERNVSMLRKRQRALAQAIQIQERRVDSVEAAASAAICNQVKPEYEKIVKDMAKILLALADIMTEEISLREHLSEQGVVSFTAIIPPCPFRLGEKPTEPYSKIALWFKEAMAEGYLNASDVSQPYRERWGIDFHERNLKQQSQT